MRASVLALLIPLVCSAGPGVARGEAEDQLERARRLGRRAAAELTGEDAVPFVSPERERREAKKSHPAATFEELRVPVGEAELLTWLVSPTRGLEDRGLVVVLPGWQSNAGFALGQTDFLLAEGYRLFIVEDRAHAYVGRASEFSGFIRQGVRDVEAALDRLAATHRLEGVPIYVYGFSWGGLKALLAAARRPEVKGVVVDAPVPRPAYLARQTFMDYMPPAARADAALFDAFLAAFDEAIEAKLGYAPSSIDVLGAAASIAPRPLMVIHSEDDDFIPMARVEALFAAAREPKTFLRGDGFGHCLGMRRAQKTYVPAVVGFLKRAKEKSAPNGAGD